MNRYAILLLAVLLIVVPVCATPIIVGGYPVNASAATSGGSGTMINNSYVLLSNGSYVLVSNTSYVLISNNSYVLTDGSRAMIGDLSFGGFAITDLLDPVNLQDAMTLNYADTNYISAADLTLYYLLDTSRALTGNSIERDVDNSFLGIHGGTGGDGSGAHIFIFGDQHGGYPGNITFFLPHSTLDTTLETMVIAATNNLPFLDMRGNNITGIRRITSGEDAINLSYYEDNIINSSYATTGTAINESYAYLPGRAGGQILTGGTAHDDSLVLNSSMGGGGNVTVRLGDNSGVSKFIVRDNDQFDRAYINSDGNALFNRFLLNDSWFSRTINDNYLYLLGGTATGTIGGRLALYGGDEGAQTGGAIFSVGDAAGTAGIPVWSVLGRTDTPYLDLNNHQIKALKDPTAAQDAVTLNKLGTYVGNNSINTTYGDHGALTGLADDDHTQYALLAGRAGLQQLAGGNAANDDLILNGTSHATKTTSYVLLQPKGGYVGINQTTPTFPLDIYYPIDGQSGVKVTNPSLESGASAVVSYKNSGSTTAITGLMGTNRVHYGTLNPNVMATYTDNVAGITTMVDAVGNITFATSDSERMKIYSDGDVKIGYSYLSVLPSYLFSIAKSYTNVFNPATPEGVLMSIENPGGNAAGRGAGMRFHLSGDRVAVMGAVTNAANTFADYVFKTYNGGASYIDALTIFSTGNISINTPSSTATFDVSGTDVRMRMYGAGAAMFDVNGRLSSVSDEKVKTAIQPFTAGLAEILKINPIKFHYSSGSGLDTANVYSGFSAQDVQKAIPEIVYSKADVKYVNGTATPTGTNTLSVYDRGLMAAMVNAIKEQQVIIKNQQGQINNLTKRVEALEKKVGI